MRTSRRGLMLGAATGVIALALPIPAPAPAEWSPQYGYLPATFSERFDAIHQLYDMGLINIAQARTLLGSPEAVR